MLCSFMACPTMKHIDLLLSNNLRAVTFTVLLLLFSTAFCSRRMFQKIVISILFKFNSADGTTIVKKFIKVDHSKKMIKSFMFELL